jgi:Spy/CpxP family protein refolding chaperone
MGPKLLLSLACTASFLAGAGLGIALDRAALFCAPRAEADSRRDSHAVARLAERLDLDPRQIEKVRAIFENYRPRYHEIMKDVRPQIEALHSEIDAELRPLLRSDQLKKLEDLRRESEQQCNQGKR